MTEPTEFDFEVKGDPEPWQVYTKRGEPTQAFERRKAWQAQVQAEAKRVWTIEGGHHEPFTGLVELSMVFYMPWPSGAVAFNHHHAPALRRKLLGQKPDCSNLYKATEDSIQGIIIKNDSQTVAGGFRKVYDGRRTGGVHIWVKLRQ